MNDIVSVLDVIKQMSVTVPSIIAEEIAAWEQAGKTVYIVGA